MYRVPPVGHWWHAVGAPVERGVWHQVAVLSRELYGFLPWKMESRMVLPFFSLTDRLLPANRLEAMQAQKAREERLEIASQKARTQLQQTSNVSQDRKKTHYQGRSEADRAQERKQFQEKQDQAREQRAKREKTRLEKSGTKAKPLPPAP